MFWTGICFIIKCVNSSNLGCRNRRGLNRRGFTVHLFISKLLAHTFHLWLLRCHAYKGNNKSLYQILRLRGLYSGVGSHFLDKSYSRKSFWLASTVLMSYLSAFLWQLRMLTLENRIKLRYYGDTGAGLTSCHNRVAFAIEIEKSHPCRNGVEESYPWESQEAGQK